MAAVQVSSFEISKEELIELMGSRGSDGYELIHTKYGGALDLCTKLKTSPTEGLTSNLSREERIAAFGSNVTSLTTPTSFLRCVWKALLDVSLFVLSITAVISLVLMFLAHLGYFVIFLVILGVVVVVPFLTALNDWGQDKRFQNLLQATRDKHTCSTIRNGTEQKIPLEELLVGDICQISDGDRLPADGIIIESENLVIDESLMAGRSNYVSKGKHTNPMVYSDTLVMEGRGKMLVTAVGVSSQVYLALSEFLAAEAEREVRMKKNGKKRKEVEGFDEGDRGQAERFLREKEKDDTDDIELCHITPVDDVTTTAKSESLPQPKVKKRRCCSLCIEKSALHGKLGRLMLHVLYAGTAIGTLLFVILIIKFCIVEFAIRGKIWDGRRALMYIVYIFKYFVASTALVVSAIPTGLPLTVTLVFIYMVKRMRSSHILVRRVNACETVGNASTIFLEATDTLTMKRVTVGQSYLAGQLYTTVPELSSLNSKVDRLLVESVSINTRCFSKTMVPENNQEGDRYDGDKIERALVEYTQEMTQRDENVGAKYPPECLVKVFPYNSVRKSFSTVISVGGGNYRLYTKGSPEVVLQRCTFILDRDGIPQSIVNTQQGALLQSAVEQVTSDCKHTVCIAYKDFVKEQGAVSDELIQEEPDWDDEEKVFENLTCIGVVGVQNPVQQEVVDATEKCKTAGICVRLITSASLNTAHFIAANCGIIVPGDDSLVLEAADFNGRDRDSPGKVSLHEAQQIWPQLRVLASSSPQDKYTVIKGIVDSQFCTVREVVAFVGGGINDTPVLRKSDVSLALAASGTGAAKQSSDIILTDDNFTSLVKAVMWGRHVYDSIVKYVQFQMTVNAVAVGVSFLGLLLIGNSVLKPVQLLWVNLVMDTLASLALASDPPGDKLLRRKPYSNTRHLISCCVLKNIIGHFIYQLLVLMVLILKGADLLGIEYGFIFSEELPSQHFTMVFNSFLLMNLFNEVNARRLNDERNVFEDLYRNPVFIGIWLGTFVLNIIIVEVGSLFFHTHSLEIDQWMWCVFFGIGTLLWGQLIITIPTSKLHVFGCHKSCKEKNNDEE